MVEVVLGSAVAPALPVVRADDDVGPMCTDRPGQVTPQFDALRDESVGVVEKLDR